MSLSPVLLAVLYALGLWWFSTGAILWLTRLPCAARGWSLAGATAAAGVAGAALVLTRDVQTPLAAGAAFTTALALWGWHELSFLTGLVTGPSVAPCPPGARGLARFRRAAATLIHHEAALALSALAVAGLTLGRANPVAGWTFLLLFAARLSAKMNLFLGVPNFSVEFFPARLEYLTTYLRKGPVTALYPASLAGLTLAAAAALRLALDGGASPAAATGWALVFALAALALLEHLFMAFALPDAALWRWALPARERPPARPSRQTLVPAEPAVEPLK